MEMRHQRATESRRLYRQLLLIYLGTLLTAIIIAHGENIFILNIPFAELWPFFTPASVAGAVLVALAMGLLSVWRLQPSLAGRGTDNDKQEMSVDSSGKPMEALDRLLRHPYELFVSFIVFGVFCSILYHSIEWWYEATSSEMQSSIDWTELLGIMAGELGMTVAIAIFLFTAVRRQLRPLILQLQLRPGQLRRRASIVAPLVITYCSTFLMGLLNLIQMAIIAEDNGSPQQPWLVGLVALFFFILGLFLFGHVTLQFRREIRSLLAYIQEQGEQGGHARRGGRMPVISYDETGELAAAFNELQGRIDKEYESIERELKLAYNVQQKLLPPGDLTIGSYRIAARCRPYREVGGDFFDVVMLGPNKFAVMIGDVSGKGVPAALIMSALLVLFRAEIKRNGSPAEVLARMNRQLCEAMGDEGAVTIGVGVIDSASDTIQYASAGHLSPYIVNADGKVTSIDSSSLPIGFDMDVVYQEKWLQLQPGDRLILYTDGIIESMDERGQMYGFEGLEEEISSWQLYDDLPKVVDDFLIRMNERSHAENDDRTIVVLELVQAYRSYGVNKEVMAAVMGSDPRENLPGSFFSQHWSLRSKLGTERAVAEEIGGFITQYWPGSGMREDVQSAVSEAIMNAMEHGNKLDPIKLVTVQAQIGMLLVVIRVYDEGGGYFPHVSRGEDEMERKRESDDPRGWGLVIIDSLSNYWSTGRDERGFFVELYFMRKLDAEREQKGVWR